MLNRKNSLFVGNPRGGRTAAILSVIESCRRLETIPHNYLADNLPGLASESIQSLKQLTPAQLASNKPR